MAQKKSPRRASGGAKRTEPLRSEHTRDRLIAEAVKLFAEQGYRGTSVAEIEAAAGLKPGNGSLYTHFESKEELLSVAMDRVVATTRAAYPFLELLPLGDTRAELTLLARAFLEVMNQWRYYLLIQLREQQRFPELFAESRRSQREGFVWFADWLRTKTKSDDDALDCDALSLVMLGAINSYWEQIALRGDPILEIEHERYIEGWVDTLMRVLRPNGE